MHDDDKIVAVITVGWCVTLIGYLIALIAAFSNGGDVNFDGAFTISDIPQGLWNAVLIPGYWLMDVLGPKVAGFLEYRPGVTSWHVVVGALAVWIGTIAGVAYALWLAGDFYESMKELIVGKLKK
jgi:hypothetical protein